MVSEIQPRQFLRLPAHADAKGENNTHTVTKVCGVKNNITLLKSTVNKAKRCFGPLVLAAKPSEKQVVH